MVPDNSKKYGLVDSTIGTRLLLGFAVSASALQQRLRSSWQISSTPASYSSSSDMSKQIQPNLILIFNDFLLNQNAQGQVQADARACCLGLAVPVTNPETGEHGVMHLRNFTDNPYAVPGHFRDALLAQVRHEQRIIGEGTSSIVTESFEFHPEIGGTIELHLEYERGPLTRLIEDRPNFPVWAALDSRIMRVYQEDTLLDVVCRKETGTNRVRREMFRVTVPELADLFDGSERLLTIMANPHYQRKVFSSGIEYADSAF